MTRTRKKPKEEERTICDSEFRDLCSDLLNENVFKLKSVLDEEHVEVEYKFLNSVSIFFDAVIIEVLNFMLSEFGTKKQKEQGKYSVNIDVTVNDWHFNKIKTDGFFITVYRDMAPLKLNINYTFIQLDPESKLKILFSLFDTIKRYRENKADSLLSNNNW